MTEDEFINRTISVGSHRTYACAMNGFLKFMTVEEQEVYVFKSKSFV